MFIYVSSRIKCSQMFINMQVNKPSISVLHPDSHSPLAHR